MADLKTTVALTNRFLNKGTAFTMEEREALSILGRLPPRVETLEEQVDRSMAQFALLEKPINQYQFLRSIQGTNNTLYYAMLLRETELLLPIIYTPTVGEACQKFGALYQRCHGIYLSTLLRGRVKESLSTSRYCDVDIIVVTDGSRILGLGDLGANGMGISIGKCSLYVVGAGLHPRRVLPVLIDAGTNNAALRDSNTYLGQRVPRVSDDEFYGLVEEFMGSVAELWPKAVVQFEDFSNNHCFTMLERYQNKFRCFNDDIQGTGAVISSGFANAVKLSKSPMSSQRILVLGAGSAAVGVAKSIAQLLALREKTPVEQALKMFYLVDTKGLVTMSRGDKLAAHKLELARTDVPAEDNAKLVELIDILRHVKPTAVLGLAGSGPMLTREMVELMCTYAERPIIFPLSNPSSKAEILPSDAYTWSKGKAIVASGSPFPGIELNGRVLKASQGNNMYVFPAVGLGVSIAQPKNIPESVLVAAAARLQELVTEDALFAVEALYPPIHDIRNVSKQVATAVIAECQRLGIVTAPNVPAAGNGDELLRFVEKHMWNPVYATDYHKDPHLRVACHMQQQVKEEEEEEDDEEDEEEP